MIRTLTTPTARFPRLRDRVRRAAGDVIVENAFKRLSQAGRATPMAKPHRHGVEVISDIPYLGTDRQEHTLDVYRPNDTPAGVKLPVALYVHGGGFRILSKETHWLMGLAFARRGYVAVLPNYRLAPKHPFPAAVQDAADAYCWTANYAADFGGDVAQFVVAGESAGANLALGLTLSACIERDEPWARQVYDTELVPSVCVPFCGILQVSQPERIMAGWRRFYTDRIHEITENYLEASHLHGHGHSAWADPLLVLEQLTEPHRPLPPFFAPVGTNDILLDDTRRLKRALDRLGVRNEAPEYVGEVHAFHALVFRAAARQCWRDTFAFVDNVLDPSPDGVAA